MKVSEQMELDEAIKYLDWYFECDDGGADKDACKAWEFVKTNLQKTVGTEMVGMDVFISKKVIERVSAEQVFNANVVETLSNLGILVYSKSEDGTGIHYRWKIELKN